MDSILTSVKRILGITEEYEHFDLELIMHINTVFTILTQMGVGVENGFKIKDKSQTWSEFTQDDSKIEDVKTYVALKVKLIFDPPASSSAMDAVNRTISELEWRLYVASDNKTDSDQGSEFNENDVYIIDTGDASGHKSI